MSAFRGAHALSVFGLAVVTVFATACSASKSNGGNPTGPSEPVTARIRTTDVLNGAAVSGATVSGSGLTAGTTDSSGSVTLTTSTSSTYGIDVARSAYITRNTIIKIPGADAAISLIASSFDLTAFDQMFRDGALRRWASTPALRVISRVVDFNNNGSTYTATDEALTGAEIDTITANMSYGLPLLTGGALPAFAGVSTQAVASGEAVTLATEGRITFARCRGLSSARGASGYAQILYIESTSVITGAMVCIDRDFELTNNPQGLAVRLHELAHALGALHVTSRSNVLMTPTISVTDITTWDRDAAKIAYQRPAGNRTPDRDPASFSTNSLRLRTLTLDECRVHR